MAPFFLVLTCALWGLSFPVIKALQLEQSARLPEAGSVFLAAWLQFARFGLAGLMLLPWLARRPRPTADELRQGLLIGFWGGLGMSLQAWGLGLTSASTSAFLTQAYCIILPAVACIRHRQPPTPRILTATLLVVAGVAILARLRPGDLTLGPGETATLASAVAFTFQILALDNPRFAANRGRPVTMIMCLFIGVLFLPIAWLTAPTPAAMIEAAASPAVALCLALLVVFCSLGAFLLMNSFQRQVSATEAGLIYTTEPVFASGYALFLPALLSGFAKLDYPNESLGAATLVGGGLILAANALMQWKRKPHRPAIAPAP